MPGSGPPRALALLAAGTLFMELLDATIIATAAPRMARSFGVQSADISVAMTAYLLTVAVLIPLSGWLADRLGVRRVFLAAIAVFTVASGLCAISTNLPELTAFRVLQGVGGAMMVPVGRLVVLRGVAKSDVIAAVAYLTWPALLAPVVAPVAGGLLTTYASWKWIFLINVPLGVIAILVAWRLVPAAAGNSPGPLDRTGLAASVIGLGALVYGASLLGGTVVSVARVALAFTVAATFLVITVVHLVRTVNPLVDLGSFTSPTFRASQAGGSLFRISVLAVPFLLPLMFEDDFGWSAARAGSVVIFVFAGNLLIKPATTPLLHRFGFRTVLMAANAMVGLATASCALLRSSTPLVVIGAVLFIGGAFRSIGFTGYNTIAFSDVSDSDMSHANTLASTLQQLAAGLGVAAAALALRVGMTFPATSGRPGASHGAYSIAFVIVALLVLPAMVEVWSLPRTAGSAIGGGMRKR